MPYVQGAIRTVWSSVRKSRIKPLFSASLVWLWLFLIMLPMFQAAAAAQCSTKPEQTDPADHRIRFIYRADNAALPGRDLKPLQELNTKLLLSSFDADRSGFRVPGANSAAGVPAEGVRLAKVEFVPDTRFKWLPSTNESLLYTGIMHTFNLGTEAGTRDTLYGPWLKDYLDSVGELRGCSDGDKFMSPYVGHTIEGAIFGTELIELTVLDQAPPGSSCSG